MANFGLWIYILFEVLIAIACSLGNVLVIWAVWTCGALRQPTFCFIVSLAFADFLVGTVAVPISVMLESQVETAFHVCLFLCCILIILQVASVAFLMAISVDRCLRVCIPLKYKSTVTKKCSCIGVSLCWFISVILGFIPLFGWHNPYSRDDSTHVISTTIECTFLAVMSRPYLVNFIFFCTLLTSLAVMSALYCYIFLATRRQLRANVGAVTEACNYYQKELHLAGSLCLVLILFAVCWLPLYLMHTVNLYSQKVRIPSLIIDIGVLLSHANSAINPVLYAFKIPKIKKEYRKLWNQLCHCGKLQQDKQNEGQDECSKTSTTAKNSGTKITGPVNTGSTQISVV